MSIVEEDLERWFSGAKKVVVAGIGNPIRGDDYVGMKILEDLKGKVPNKVLLLECETVPESFLLDIEEFHPTHVLLIDAALQGLNAGEAKLVQVGQIAEFSAVTTHILPLNLFCDYITQTTGAKISLLLIEPKNMEFGEGLSPEVKASALKLTDTLLELLK